MTRLLTDEQILSGVRERLADVIYYRLVDGRKFSDGWDMVLGRQGVALYTHAAKGTYRGLLLFSDLDLDELLGEGWDVGCSPDDATAIAEQYLDNNGEQILEDIAIQREADEAAGLA